MKKKKGLGKVGATARGFEVIRFDDKYHIPCSLQMSSLAEHAQPGISAIWLGPNEARPMVMAVHAASVGVETKEEVGWVPYPIPDCVSLTTRMHLDRKQVQKLINNLTSWLETGSFKV